MSRSSNPGMRSRCEPAGTSRRIVSCTGGTLATSSSSTSRARSATYPSSVVQGVNATNVGASAMPAARVSATARSKSPLAWFLAR